MKRFFLLAGLTFLVALVSISAQNVERISLANMGDWQPGSGSWSVSGGRLYQSDPSAPLARVDRRMDQSGVYEIEFTIRYEDGGFYSEQALRNGEYHAGFGVQLGGTNPRIGRASWGVGESYLLWLNLDTRRSTFRDNPEHFGFRAQVYESRSNSDMTLLSDPAMRSIIGQSLVSIDLYEALSELGVTEQVLMTYLDRPVRVNIRVNTRTGEIGVLDPTAPVRYYFRVAPATLRGDYVSLRTNNLAASYGAFSVRQ